MMPVNLYLVLPVVSNGSIAPCQRLNVIYGAVDTHLRAPETKVNVFAGHKFLQIELAPAMPTKEAKETFDRVRFVFAMRPQLT